MRSLIGGLKDYRRNLFINFALTVVLGWLITYCVSEACSAGIYFTKHAQMTSLYQENIVRWYVSNGKHPSSETEQTVFQMVSSGKAAMITVSPDDDFILYAVGDVSHLSGIHQLPDSDTMHFLVGKRSGYQPGDTFLDGDFAKTQLEAERYFDKDEWILGPYGDETVSLDRYSVIFMTAEQYRETHYTTDLSHILYLIDCSEDEILSLMSAGIKDGMNPAVSSLNDTSYSSESPFIGKLFVIRALTQSGMLILIIFIVVSMLLLNMEYSMKEYCIHLIYGALPIHIFIRTFVYGILLTIPGILYTWIKEREMQDINAYIRFLPVGMLAATILCAFISAFVTYRFCRYDYASFLHSNE